MKFWKPNPSHDFLKGIHFFHITMPWGGVLTLSGECQGPVWWLPKIQASIKEKYFRIGWLLFAGSIGYITLKDRFKRAK